MATGYTGTIQLVSTDPQVAAAMPAPHPFTAADQGVYTFSSVPFDTSGGQTVTATPVTTNSAMLAAATANSAMLTAAGRTAPVTGKGSVIVNPALADPSQSTVSIAPGMIQAGSTATVTLVACDLYGNQQRQGGLTVHFILGTTGGGGTFSSVIDNGDGTYSATFTATTAGYNTIPPRWQVPR